MSGQEHSNPGTGKSPRELLDAYFDGELDRAGKGLLHEAMRHDPHLAEEFSRTSEALSMLRQSAANTALPVDLTNRVLASYEARRGFLTRRGHRFVLAGRTAVALTALAITAGIVAWVRLTPPEFRLPESQRPLGVLIDRGASDAATMQVVPPRVQRELADSVDPSKIDPNKVERTIVFNLRPDDPGTFSAFASVADRSTQPHEGARLPLLASVAPRGHEHATGAHAPLRQDGMSAASIVRDPDSTPTDRPMAGWWSRQTAPTNTTPRVLYFGRVGGGAWLLLPEPASDAMLERK